jgi:hypothetical protein
MALLATIIGFSTRTAAAANVETLLMPGKVSAAHAKLEENCSACHDKADRLRQTPLCLDCHKDIAKDIVAQRGHHGRMANADKTQCRACHTEHKGRDADIVNFTPEGFDHGVTDFPLQGAHAALACGNCHKKGVAYRKADTACIACHRAQDIHKNTLGEACANCHEVAAWNKIRFDHEKTAFPLREAHAKLECNSCHFGPRYKGTPKRCVDCHAPDDVHKGSRGEDCGKCHTMTSWKTAKFDHSKETGFALNDAHGTIECTACHTTGNYKDKIPKDCHGCHLAQDSHAGRFGTDCRSCHSEVRWKPLDYDHLKLTKFALLGAHAHLDCHTCHTSDVARQKLATDCVGCHKSQDPHGGELGNACEQCHNNETWLGRVRFDHDLTSYPLLGQHVLAGCAQCHSSLAFKGAAKACVACHRAQDVHKGGLGDECAACHSPDGWNLWEFDHAKETGFALSGAHRKLTCANCHREPPKKLKLATDCASCHEKDDIHVGEFGRQCQRCHTTVSFSAASIH